MRHAIVRVPSGQGHRVATEAREHGAVSASWWPATNEADEIDIVSMVIDNRSVGPLLERLDNASVLLYPHEVLTFTPPASRPTKALRNLKARSPLEIFLLSLQSVGSWPSFLGYAAAGAVLTWVAFFTNSAYLLIAAMLIAPFAGPAMNVALATAVGDLTLFRRSLTRYFVGILASTILAGLLSFTFQQSIVTGLMTGVGHVSAAAVLLPLVAGAAGAFNLIQSERSSLVSGTAVGMLVTASLAPPAALIGVASVMQEWSLVQNSVFQLLLQLAGINLGGSLVFRQRGLGPSLRKYERFRKHMFHISVAVSSIGLAALLVWQFTTPLRLQRSSRSTEAAETIRSIVKESDVVRLVSVDADFRSSEAYGENTLLANVYVERAPGSEGAPSAMIADRLEQEIQRKLQSENPRMAPLITVTILDPPPYTPVTQGGVD